MCIRDSTYIRSEADENSEWVGKLYSDSAAVVLEYLDGDVYKRQVNDGRDDHNSGECSQNTGGRN